MNKSKPITLRIPDPFDDSAQTRLTHMGVLDKDSQPSSVTMQAFATIFTGLFYDDICEYYDDAKNLLTIYNTFCELHRKSDYQHMFLFLSLQYDYIRKPLPDPVWWLAGDSNAVREFMELFIQRLEQFYAESGFSETKEVEG